MAKNSKTMLNSLRITSPIIEIIGASVLLSKTQNDWQRQIEHHFRYTEVTHSLFSRFLTYTYKKFACQKSSQPVEKVLFK